MLNPIFPRKIAMSSPLKLRLAVGFAIASLPLLIAHFPLANADDKDKKSLNEKVKEIAGTAEFLRSVPKAFGKVTFIDPPHNKIALLVEGETLAKVWRVAPDAEIKRAGWWGRLN